jgi:hypothetical protein
MVHLFAWQLRLCIRHFARHPQGPRILTNAYNKCNNEFPIWTVRMRSSSNGNRSQRSGAWDPEKNAVPRPVKACEPLIYHAIKAGKFVGPEDERLAEQRST